MSDRRFAARLTGACILLWRRFPEWLQLEDLTFLRTAATWTLMTVRWEVTERIRILHMEARRLAILAQVAMLRPPSRQLQPPV